jgi:LmbE family N-acetylglucosaminyl deacetylase
VEQLPRGRVVVVSPHLDDAVFSLGAAIAEAARDGASVTVVTVFAGNPDSSALAGEWDAHAGFHTAAEAARARRVEDERALRLLGAEAVWLPFEDRDYRPHIDVAAVRGAVEESAAGADAVLVPGFPLMNTDHALLSEILRDASFTAPRVGVYIEQPYGMWADREPSPPLGDWLQLGAGLRSRLAKARACKAYASQLPLLGPRLTLNLLLRQGRRMGERIRWLREEQ